MASHIPVGDTGRIVIEKIRPQINGGRFPIKRIVGQPVTVSADIHADGHDILRAVLLYRPIMESHWTEVPMTANAADVWSAEWIVASASPYEYTVEAWVDRFATWRHGMKRKVAAGVAMHNDFLEGAQWIEASAGRADEDAALDLRRCANQLRSETEKDLGLERALSAGLLDIMTRYGERHAVTRKTPPLRLTVDAPKAVFSSWYEFFPRSAGKDPTRSATLREAEDRLPAIAEMGFSVVYLPPVHPIGKSFRKGPNNSSQAGPEDPGSPWAIGSPEGGHKAVDPQLGTLDDFDHFVQTAAQLELSVALDIAFQCSPDHPYVRDHPEWFRHRPDGSIQFAENPPKRYEDIVPFDFECADRVALWNELRSVVEFWIGHGVRLFRVDNPHTKPYAFWEWLIDEIQQKHRDILFLAEAFTRPKPMQYLAKCGFSMSYTYFTWRNTKSELTEFMSQWTVPPVSEYLRPNFFINTPDILHAFLQEGGRVAHQIRLVLAATLSSSYGIYGPPFELCESRAVPNTEEYLDSEKYQIRVWDYDRPGNIRELITLINRIRRENPALQRNDSLHFYPVSNDFLLAYTKHTPDPSNVILVVVNLDPYRGQEGWVHFSGADLGAADKSIEVHDLLSGARYLWGGPPNYVRLDPSVSPAHIFRVRRKIRTEKDFDYFQ